MPNNIAQARNHPLTYDPSERFRAQDILFLKFPSHLLGVYLGGNRLIGKLASHNFTDCPVSTCLVYLFVGVRIYFSLLRSQFI